MTDLQKIVAAVPKTLGQELGIENRERLTKDCRSIVVCGMGGSGVIGELLAGLFPELKITTHKTFGLPHNFNPRSLFLVISYSGETKEALAAFEEAEKKSAPVAVITGGGTLLDWAAARKVPFSQVKYEKTVPARFQVGSLLRAGLQILEAVKLIPQLSSYLAPIENFAAPSPDLTLARELADGTTLLYAPDELVGLATFWKLTLNETAKQPAYVNTIPEMLHSEIEAIDAVTRPFLMLFDDPEVDERVRLRVAALENLARSRNWRYRLMRPERASRITKVVSSLMTALSTGLTIAELKKIDPTQSLLINELKKKL